MIPIKVIRQPNYLNPPQGYKEPIDEATGKELPYPPHLHPIFNKIKHWFDNEFPNCCDTHKALANESWFDKRLYIDVPDRVTRHLAYTEHVFLQNIDKPDWYKKITDYIYHNLLSFGQPSIGHTFYLGTLRQEFQIQDISEEKKVKLVQYIDDLSSPAKQSNNHAIQLINTYNRWLNLFPFELSFFAELKTSFENDFKVFIKGKPRRNKYAKVLIMDTHPPSNFMQVLLNLTDKLLTEEINSLILYEKGELTEREKLKEELIINQRRQKLKTGYQAINNSSELVSMINKWFEDEKKFIDEIKPYLRPTNTPKSFADYLQIENQEKFAKGLKHEFTTEKGVKIQILIEILKEKGIITLGNSDLSKFINAMSNYFERKIGYEAVRKAKDVTRKNIAYKADFQAITTQIERIVKEL